MDLADLIERNAAFAPDKPAIHFSDSTLTYAAFAARIAAAARALKSQLGIGRGDRVAILSLNHPDYLVLLYACARLGAMLVPLNWRGAVLRQEALVWNAVMGQHMHDMTAADHVLTVLPLFHVGGLNIQTTPALQIGATVTLHPRFMPETTLDALARDRPTLTVLVPATMQAVIEHPRWRETDPTCLRALTTGSTQVPQGLVDAFTERGVPVLQVYGSTETCPIAVYTRVHGDQRAGSTGLPGLVCEARVVDDAGCEVASGVAGEVVVRGPNVFFEYWGNAAATAETLREGWYHSGDIGTRDADGHFFIHDRKKNMIVSGGENIYPAEVERVLLAHPDVAEGAVIGRADAKWQEVPVAYVVRRPNATCDARALEAHLLSQLARFKVPREYVFVDALPRNAMGKVQHFRLRDLDAPLVPAKAATQSDKKKELDSRLRGNERQT